MKTGCQFEKVQLETGAALVNAFAVTLPVAVCLLALRDVARTSPQARAGDVLTALQIKILAVHEHTRALPLWTARDAMLAVARLVATSRTMVIRVGLCSVAATRTSWPSKPVRGSHSRCD